VLPPLDLIGTLANDVATLPQLLWRPSVNFRYDSEESTHRRLKRLLKSWDASRSATPEKTAADIHALAIACVPDVSATIAGHLYNLASELALQNKILFGRPAYDPENPTNTGFNS
jgi:hypothetical protein